VTSYLESNLEVLSRSQPGLARFLGGTGQTQIELSPSFKGPLTACYRRKDGSALPLHSRYDPLQEARRALKESDLAGADYFILLGFGLGYLLDALLERTGSEEHHFFVIESEPGILRAAFA
jgi:hypothetical protein